MARESDWKFCSKEIGWLGIILNGLCLFLFRGIEDHILAYATFCTFVLNIACSCIWLCGIALNKPDFMMGALIGWGIQLSVWILFIIIFAVPGLIFGNEYARETVLSILSVSFFLIVFSVIYFYYAVKSYKKLKEVIEKNRLSVAYTVTSTENNEINIKYRDLELDRSE